MQLINLTPHDINLIDEDDKCYLSIPPTSPPARCEENLYEYKLKLWFILDGIRQEVPQGELSYNNVYGLPPAKDGVMYVVSVLVAQSQSDRRDLFVPHDLVRKNGQIIGCRRLVRIA